MGVEGAPSSLTSNRADPWNLLCLRSLCSTTVSYSDGISSYTWTLPFSGVADSQRRVQRCMKWTQAGPGRAVKKQQEHISPNLERTIK